jgi:tRNA threonylcarbamoyladenosine biosynthesis protein TsaE
MAQGTLTWQAADEGDTERLGRALAAVLAEGGVVGLIGPLGAGKTRLVQGIAAALGVDRRDVVSPTFVLVHEYRGGRPIYHLDTYRLRDSDEFLQLGVEEYFAPPNVVFVEWADRFPECLPPERVDVTIAAGAGTARRFEFVGRGERYQSLVDELARRLAAT